jgi:ferritin-like metal-binding protein YciE
LGEEPSGETCKAMQGLLAEGEDYVKAGGDREVRDAGLIGAAQKVEHYEIAGYGTARTLATRLGEPKLLTSYRLRSRKKARQIAS